MTPIYLLSIVLLITFGFSVVMTFIVQMKTDRCEMLQARINRLHSEINDLYEQIIQLRETKELLTEALENTRASNVTLKDKYTKLENAVCRAESLFESVIGKREPLEKPPALLDFVKNEIEEDPA